MTNKMTLIKEHKDHSIVQIGDNFYKAPKELLNKLINGEPIDGEQKFERIKNPDLIRGDSLNN